MSWPREHEGKVQCIGFPEKYLSAIKNAVENKMVKWGKITLFMTMGEGEFEWAGCTWRLTEIQECVTSIALLKGTPIEEDLTVAVLKGKLEAS